MNGHSHDHLTGEMPKNHLYQSSLLIGFFIVWIIDSFFLKLTTFLSDLPLFWLFIIPVVLILVYGMYLMKKSHEDMFETRVETVQSEGIYSRVRHPMYLGTVLVYLSLALLTLSLATLVFWIVIFVFYNVSASYEERLLEERFGDAYLEYKNNVRKWIPI
jgi:protein-S-isoprenylcysteine O-methyltransferase Ste14